MSICPLSHLRFACVLNGLPASLTPPQHYIFEKYTSYLPVIATNKQTKNTPLSRWKEEKVPSISQVFFDDSDLTLTQDYPVSTKQTPTEHQELKTEMISWPLPSKISFSQWQVGGNVPAKSIKQWDRCVQWVPGTQTNEEATQGTAGGHQQWGGFPGRFTASSRDSEQVGRAEAEQGCRPLLPKSNIQTPGLTQNGVFILIVCTHFHMSWGKKYNQHIKPRISYI